MPKNREHPFLPTLFRQLEAGKLSRREFLRTATLLGLSAGAAYAVAGKITGGTLLGREAQAADLPKGGTLRVGMPVQALNDPHTYEWYQSDIARQVVQYLTRTGQDNITRPDLLAKWEASDDLKTWTLFLRPEVKWHDGRPFVADDVVWNLQHLLDPATGSSALTLMKGYMLTETTGADGKASVALWDANAIEKVDDHTVRLNLKAPQLAVPEHLFHYPMHMLDPAENGQFGPGSNGTGPFTLVEAEVGVKATLEAYADYWGEGPHLDRIEIIDLGEDSSTQLNALESNQIDLMRTLDVSLLDRAKSMEHAIIYDTGTTRTAVARVHVDEKPFDDPRVRKAMRLALDAPKILELVYVGYGLPGEHHHVAPLHPEYADVGSMPRDLAAAKQLLADAGYPNGVDLTLVAPSDPSWMLSTVQAMQVMWAEAGIRVQLDVRPSAQYWDIWMDVPFGFTSWAPRPLGVMVLSLAYKSGAVWNESRYANPEFDTLLGEAEAMLDIEERRAVMAKIERIMQEDGPIMQPIWASVFAASSDRVVGFKVHPASWIFGEELALKS
jgi:peptide/nickel transport system substrate-binding protein